MMFTSYQQEAIDRALSFDILMYSEDPQEEFVEERALLKEENVQEPGQRIFLIMASMGLTILHRCQ